MERPAATGGLWECGCRLRRHQFLSQSRDSLELCLEQLYPSGMYLMEVQLSVVTGWGGGLELTDWGRGIADNPLHCGGKCL